MSASASPRWSILSRIWDSTSVAATCALSLVLVWALALFAIQKSWVATQNRALASVEQQATTLAVEWQERIALIRLLHQNARTITRAALAHDPHVSELRDNLGATLASFGQELSSVAGIGADGSWLWSTSPFETMQPDDSEKPFLAAILQHGQQSFVDTQPAQTPSAKTDIVFAEAIPGPDQSPIGVTVVTINWTVIEKMAKALNNPQGRVIGVLRRDGAPLASDSDTPLSRQMRYQSPLFLTAAQTGAASGQARGWWSGIPRFFAFRSIEGSDLMVMVGIDEKHAMALAALYRDSTLGWASAFSAVIVLAAIGWVATERRRRLSRLRQTALETALENDAMLSRIAQRSDDVILLLDAQFNFIFVTDAYARLLGIPNAVLDRRKITDGVVEADLPILEAAISQLSHDGATVRVAFRVHNASRGEIFVEAQVLAVNSEQADGKAHLVKSQARYLVIARDMTDRMQAEQKLRETQNHIRTLLALTHGSISTTELDHHGNEIASQLSPLTSSEPSSPSQNDPVDEAQQMVWEVFPEDAELLRQAYLRARDDGSATCEFRYVAADGKLCWRRTQLALVWCDEKGFKVIAHGTEITAEKDTYFRMMHAERLASLGEITTHLAHELNQPLASIALAAETGLRRIERDASSTEDAAIRLRRIVTQTHRMGCVIDHVRKLSRTDDRQRRPFQISDLVKEMRYLTEQMLLDKSIELVFDQDGCLPALTVPRIPLEQVLLNLISNACEAYLDCDQTACHRDTAACVAAPTRTITVASRCARGTLEISVSDQAGGVPEAIIDRIFEPFFTTKPLSRSGGTGVGLALSRTTIEEMGGELTVHNIDGGARFTISLPAVAGCVVMAMAMV